MYRVGDIAAIKTRDVIGKDFALKYHFCVCARNRDYLYVCTRGFPGDYPITIDDCLKLEHTSHISLSRVFHVPDQKIKRSKLLCTVNKEYVKGFREHVSVTRVLSERDRKRILRGIDLHLAR
jgi:hypothetical protein